MATYLGSFPRRSQPVALFSGLRVSPRGYGGFGAIIGFDEIPPSGLCKEYGSDWVRSPDGTRCDQHDDTGSGTWQQLIKDILGEVLPIFDPILKKWLDPNTGQPLPVQPPAGMSTAEVLRILEAKKLPAWLLPVGIGVGVLVIGGVLYAVLRK